MLSSDLAKHEAVLAATPDTEPGVKDALKLAANRLVTRVAQDNAIQFGWRLGYQNIPDGVKIVVSFILGLTCYLAGAPFRLVRVIRG
jgi:riboflavin synthase